MNIAVHDSVYCIFFRELLSAKVTCEIKLMKLMMSFIQIFNVCRNGLYAVNDN